MAQGQFISSKGEFLEERGTNPSYQMMNNRNMHAFRIEDSAYVIKIFEINDFLLNSDIGKQSSGN